MASAAWLLPRDLLLVLARTAAAPLSRVLPMRAVQKNLRIIRSVAPAAWDGRDETRMAVEAVRHHLETAVDFFKLVSEAPPELLAWVDIEGWERLADVMARGRGAVLLGSHFSNWELTGAVLARRGLPMHAFYYQQLLPALDDFLGRARQRAGIRLLHQRRGLRTCMEVLHAGGAVAFVADQDGSRDGVFLDFFGRLVSLPRGPYEFARHAGCEVVPVSTLRLPGGRYRITLGKPFGIATAADVPVAASRMAALFEADILRDPAQWLLFYDRFWARHQPRLRELGLLERALEEQARDEGLAGGDGDLRTTESAPVPVGPPRPRRQCPDLVRLALWFYLPMLALGAAWMAYRGRLDRFLWAGGWPGFAAATALGLAIAAITIGFSQLATSRFAWGRALKDAFSELLGGIDISTAISLAALSALGEEAVFRGALQPELGLFAASALFGAIHFPVEKRLYPWTLFAVIMGFCLGWLYESTQGLFAPVLAHFVVNAVNLTFLSRDYPQSMRHAEVMPPSHS